MSLFKPRNMLILGIIAFLAMSFLSLYSMPVDMNGNMVNCPFMNSSVNLCQMSLNDHINQWQQMFTALPNKTNLAYILFLASLLFAATVIFRNKFLESAKLLFPRQVLYIKQKKYLVILDPLKEAFYGGIITPKIF